MVWIRLDDQIAHHPKFIEAGPVAAWLWVCGNGYCNKYLTDGFIPAPALPTLGGLTKVAQLAARLVHVGLWEKVPGGYQVHDFHDFNPTAKEVRARRISQAKAGKAGAAARWGNGKFNDKSHGKTRNRTHS